VNFIIEQQIVNRSQVIDDIAYSHVYGQT